MLHKHPNQVIDLTLKDIIEIVVIYADRTNNKAKLASALFGG